jgi:hypothetical protein
MTHDLALLPHHLLNSHRHSTGYSTMYGSICDRCIVVNKTTYFKKM